MHYSNNRAHWVINAPIWFSVYNPQLLRNGSLNYSLRVWCLSSPKQTNKEKSMYAWVKTDSCLKSQGKQWLDSNQRTYHRYLKVLDIPWGKLLKFYTCSKPKSRDAFTVWAMLYFFINSYFYILCMASLHLIMVKHSTGDTC